MASRIERISAHFLGRPYRVNPLIGTAEAREVFVHDTDAFDCVTYVETVLARANARTAGEFLQRLRRLRYRSGQVSWLCRNHYMTQWIRNNRREGFVREVALSPHGVVKSRVLETVPGLPAQKQRFRCFPKRLLSSAE